MSSKKTITENIDAKTSAQTTSSDQELVISRILTFADEGGKAKYPARVLHWTVADREAHEKMGFHQGWGQWRS